jgi:hypothetical protein
MFKHENARINVLGRAPHIITDFGEGDVLPGEDERAAAIRIYREWCTGKPYGGCGDSIEPDPTPTVVLHDVRRK